MARRNLLLLILLSIWMLSIVGTAAGAEETVWVPAFEVDYAVQTAASDETVIVISPGTTLTRSIGPDGLHWIINSSSREFVTLPVEGFVFPPEFQHQLEITLQLPNSDHYLCAGAALNQDASTFSALLLCNDHTYGAVSYENGNWRNLIPFNALPDYDWNASVTFAVRLNGGWADFYFAGNLLDTTPLPHSVANLSLFAQQIDDRNGEVWFRKISQSVAKAESTESGLPAGTPADAAKTLRLLSMKDRFPVSSAGTFLPYEDFEMSLAQMGYQQSRMIGQSARDLLIRSHISWNSAYMRPNYSQSGCGYTFRSQPSGTMLQVLLSLDGAVYLTAYRNGAAVPLASYNYGNWSLEGDGVLTVAVGREKITVLYDDRILGTVTDASWIGEGDLGFTTWSGTNYEKGITCNFRENTILLFEGKDL